MVVFVDLDGVLCTNTDGRYERAQPMRDNIAKVNQIYDEGHTIVIWTARGATTGKDWHLLTAAQLSIWGVKHHCLRLDKPHYDLFIDDKTRAHP